MEIVSIKYKNVEHFHVTVGATLSSMQWTLPRNEPRTDGLLLSHTTMINYITCSLLFFFTTSKTIEIEFMRLGEISNDLIFIDYGTIFLARTVSPP